MSYKNDNSKKDDSVGAFWEKQSIRGPFLSGGIKCSCGLENKVVAFKNDRKTKENQPDWKVLKQKPRAPEDKYKQATFKPVDTGSVAPSTLFEEDVPF